MDDAQLGSAIRAVRIKQGLTQAELAARVGVSRSIVSLIERGRAEETTLSTVRRVAASLGVSVAFIPRWRGADLAKLLDHNHATLVESVVERISAAGWTVRPEHTFSIWGERGSIDVMAWLPAARALVLVECKTSLPDLQDALSTMDRKRRLGPEIARLEGWDPRLFASVLVLPDSTWARNRVHKSNAIFAAALPARTVEVRCWIAAPSGSLRGIWFLPNDSTTNAMRGHSGLMRIGARRGARAGPETGGLPSR
jgi:transcriptional regulator with XRE-family HTH domain